MLSTKVVPFRFLIKIFLSIAQDIQSMTMLCPDHLEDAGHLGKCLYLFVTVPFK